MSEWVSEWVSEWQGHLLSYSGQLKIYPPTPFPVIVGLICLPTFISSKFGHQMAPLALVPSWRGNSSYGVRCASGNVLFKYASSDLLQIGSKFGNQVTSLPKFEGCPPGWVTCIATLPWITLLTLSVSIKLVSLSARVTSVKFQHGVVLTETRHIDRTRRPGSDKNILHFKWHPIVQYKIVLILNCLFW